MQANGTTFRYTGLGLSSASNSGGQTYYTRDNQGQLVSMRTTSGTYYYHLNALGSVSVLTNSSGAVKNSHSYNPWGNSLAKTEAVANPWQFAAGYYDATTGLYKFGTRYYDPKLGRWTQQDPVGGSLGGSNSGSHYVYANDNPVMLTDPSGTLTNWQCALLGAATFLAVLAGIGGITGTGNILVGIAQVIASGPKIAEVLATAGLTIAEKAVPFLGWAALAVQAIFAAGATVGALKTACCL